MSATIERTAATERAITRLMQNAALGRADKVQKLDARRYVVTSGTSGNQYLVNTALSTCDCAAGRFGRLCRHRIAALTFERALEKCRRDGATEARLAHNQQISGCDSRPCNQTSSTPQPPRPRPVRPAHVPASLWNHLSASERRDVADGRMTFRPMPLSNRWHQYLDGYLIGTVRA